MTRIIFLLIILFFSCKQSEKKVKAFPATTNDVRENALNTDSLPLTDSPYYTLVDNKASLDSLFFLKRDLSEFSLQNMWTSLLIGYLFNKDKKSAVMRYKENDTVSNILVLQQTKRSWDTLFSTKIYPVSTTALEDLVQVEDFNGDNVPDLKVVKNAWDIHPGENSELWLYGNEHFTKVKGFDTIVSATFDKNTGLIYSYHSTGCADMDMYFGVFKIEAHTVQRIKEMYCNCCVEANDSCTIEVFGEKSFPVPYKTAYKYVPSFFASSVKEKCEMVANRP